MKIALVSDVHLEFGDLDFENNSGADVLILGGDICVANDMAQRGLILPRHNDLTRCYFPNYRLGKWTGSPCDTLGFTSPPGNGFKDVAWPGGQRIESPEEIKVLKLPPGFYIPASDGQPYPPDYNPLNMKTLMLKEQERRRQPTLTPSSQPEPKHD
jgi:hypothetical protein